MRPFKFVSGDAQRGVHQGKQQLHTGAGDSPQRHPTAREKDTSERARERERERERARASERERARERERAVKAQRMRSASAAVIAAQEGESMRGGERGSLHPTTPYM